MTMTVLQHRTTAGELLKKLVADGRQPMEWEKKNQILKDADKEVTNIFFLEGEGEESPILVAANHSDRMWFSQSLEGRDQAIIPKGSRVYFKEE